MDKGWEKVREMAGFALLCALLVAAGAGIRSCYNDDQESTRLREEHERRAESHCLAQGGHYERGFKIDGTHFATCTVQK